MITYRGRAHGNARLIHTLERHDTLVVDVREREIDVLDVSSWDGALWIEVHTIPATMGAVRDWLGY